MRAALPEIHALLRQAVAALEAGDLAAAESMLRATVDRYPAAHEGWNLLSVVAVRSGQAEMAAGCARKAVELDRRNVIYLNNLGIACGELGELAEAESAFRRALKLKPAYPQALYNLAKALHKQSKVDEALKVYERAYAMDPEHPGLRRNLAQLYQLRGDPRRALALLREAARLDEESYASTYASCLADADGEQPAIAWLSQTLGQRPDWSALRFERALYRLGLGQWRDGWTDYLSRPGVPAGARASSLPRKLDAASVLLCSEQGLGDTLFFMRFVPRLRERGARLALHCPPKLLGLLRGCAAIDEVIDEQEAVPQDRFAHTVWLGDLPALVESAVPEPALPLRADREAPDRLAVLGSGPTLGLTWRAGTDMHAGPEFGARRAALSKEVPLEALAAAIRGWPGTVVALQRNPLAGEIEKLGALAGTRIHDLSALNEDLVAMTAALDALDEYVAVSNTNVHLRAGLGKAARVVVPRPPEWRWMSDGERSPWFPQMPVYRQPVSRDWAEPLARLRADLVP